MACLSAFVSSFDNKLEIDTISGQNACKNFLKCVQKLFELTNAKACNRDYRLGFTKAYQILYQKDSLCYLNEILDSAQEGVPSLYVNGAKFDFSEDVLIKGNSLFKAFIDLQQVLKKCYLTVNCELKSKIISIIKSELKEVLENFDKNWTEYEEKYIFELMEIELEARKYITDSIEIELKLTQSEENERKLGKVIYNSEDYKKYRQEMVLKIALLNSIANFEGHGRDDLKINILEKAERTLATISPMQSLSIRNLSENIKKSFADIRLLLRKYSMHIDIVDPQLRNNVDLVECLTNYEKYWEWGNEFLLNEQKFIQIIYFSNLLEGLREKYTQFNDMIEDIDTNLFVIIPMILILKSFDNEDNNICELFLPDIKKNDSKTNKIFKKAKEILFSIDNNYLSSSKKIGIKDNRFRNSLPPINSGYKTLLKNQKNLIEKKPSKLSHFIYNLIEKLIIEIQLEHNEKDIYNINSSIINEALHGIRMLSMEMQRSNPTEWNSFLNVAMDNKI